MVEVTREILSVRVSGYLLIPKTKINVLSLAFYYRKV
jgi:hypothetical protein